MKATAWLLTLALIGCTHIVTDAPLDVVDARDAPELADLPDGHPDSCTEACDDARTTEADEVAPACQSSCGAGTCPEGQCCEQGLCHAVAPAPLPCGWFVPGQQGRDELCRVDAGAYYVGCDNGTTGCDSESQPRVKAQLTHDVWLDRFEVTNAQYRAYLADAANTGTPAPDCDLGADLWNLSTRTLLDSWRADHPVVCVNAAEAQAYCAWREKVLPTEAAWEAAARGSDAYAFPWPKVGGQDTFDTHKAQCYRNWDNYESDTQCADTWPANTCEGPDDVPDTVCRQKTAPVTLDGSACSLAAGESPAGLCHAAGNAAEWVADAWQGDHDAWGCVDLTPCADPFAAPQQGDKRVVKGGSWDSTVDEIRTWARDGVTAAARTNTIGFRCGWVE